MPGGGVGKSGRRRRRCRNEWEGGAGHLGLGQTSIGGENVLGRPEGGAEGIISLTAKVRGL